MASTKLAFWAVAVLLLHASWCAVARHHHDPDPCRDLALLGHKDHGCSSAAVSPQDGGSTPAVMAVTSFEDIGSGPAACDDRYHSDGDQLAALSTGWYEGGMRCHKQIVITSTQTGRSVEATVVDECDSQSGGCYDNMVATSKAVWDVLGLDTNIGEVPITWLQVS